MNKVQRSFLSRFQNQDMPDIRAEMRTNFLTQHPEYVGTDPENERLQLQKFFEDEEKARRKKLKDHIQTFSDCVIGVIITISLFQLPLPNRENFYHAYLSGVGTFMISFFIMANFWLEHHRVFERAEEISEAVIILDFFYLGNLALFPFFTQWMIKTPNRESVVGYGIAIVIYTLLLNLIQVVIGRESLRHLPKTRAFYQRVAMGRMSSSLALTFLILIFSYYFPTVGHWFYIGYPILSFIMTGLQNSQSQTGLWERANRISDRQRNMRYERERLQSGQD
ncbi:MAG: TMEM175 family protein [Streptococcaceae bacterium]|jgi:uncharacterized membrane protein|nr:TMEM175 family protein [Streptococcaceae bacterium]